MATKLVKKTSVKSTKNRRSRHSRQRSRRNKSRVEPVSLVDTIKRGLTTFFSKLAQIGPIGCAATCTDRRSSKKKGYALMNKVYPHDKETDSVIDLRNDSDRRILFSNFEKESINNQPQQHKHRLPPPISPKKRTVFLDLDETLVHSKAEPPPKRFDFAVRPNIGGNLMTFYVLKRPGVEEFLEELSARYEVVVFTAGLKEYASLVLDKIDKKGLISHRLYRDSCRWVDGRYVKDLSETGRDLDKVVIVDDNPNSYFLHPKNAVPIKPFISDMTDTELWSLMKFFDDCDSFGDMRDAVKHHFVNNGGDEHNDDEHFEVVI